MRSKAPSGKVTHDDVAVLPPISPPSAADEANHRVANSLQLLSALISSEARGVSDPAMRNVLELTQNRITAIASVHRHLYAGQGDDDVDLGHYLEDLGEQIARSCPSHRRVTVDAGTILVKPGTATSVGILVTELVTNACKHAYPADAPGNINVTLHRMNDGRHCLVVEDQGCGGHQAAERVGLGRRLIEAIVARLGATAHIEDAKPGMRFVMHGRF
jgi:two-component sensor histidine kinase